MENQLQIFNNPVIDDAESYTVGIDLPNQIWLFKVTDEPELKIEVKKVRLAA